MPKIAHDTERFGDRVRAARKRTGLSQRQFADQVGVSAAAVAQWENGGLPATDRLVRIAKCTNTSIDWLLGIEPAEDDLALVHEARAVGIDLRIIIDAARQDRWRQENADALADANDFVDKHGLWSEAKRLF